MTAERELGLSIQQSHQSEAHPEGEGILEALKAAKGFDDIGDKISGTLDPATSTEEAYFSVCDKSGSGFWLDVWDTDHFDGGHAERAVTML
jgi:hypothetical protein